MQPRDHSFGGPCTPLGKMILCYLRVCNLKLVAFEAVFSGRLHRVGGRSMACNCGGG